MTNELICIPAEPVESSVHVIRGRTVILDHGMARFYGVTIRMLQQAVKRNRDRFPPDFMFQLTTEETRNLNLRPQNSKYRPYAFTAEGILMLSSVLRSERAVQTNVETMRALVRLRKMMKARVVKRRQIGFLG